MVAGSWLRCESGGASEMQRCDLAGKAEGESDRCNSEPGCFVHFEGSDGGLCGIEEGQSSKRGCIQ